MKEIIIRDIHAGGRIDKFLFRYLDKAPKSFVYKMMRKKNIVLNDRKTAGNEILCPGDTIKLYLADETIAGFRSDTGEAAHAAGWPELVSGESISQRVISGDRSGFPDPEQFKNLIVFEDDNLIAANKPCGMLSQKARRDDISVNELLAAYLDHTGNMPDGFQPGISNRLDRNTSGIVMCAKNAAASRILNEAVRERTITKKYLTVVKGRVGEGGSLRGWHAKNNAGNKVDIISGRDLSHGPGPAAQGKASIDGIEYSEVITEYRPVAGTEDMTLLEVGLITGKTHQIRAQMAEYGHPLAGDAKYGDQQFNAYFRKKYGLRHHLLHAGAVGFHDMYGILEYLNGTEIKASVPEEFKTILKEERLWLPGEAGV